MLGIKADESVVVTYANQQIQTDQFHIDAATTIKMKGFNNTEMSVLLQKAAKTHPLFISSVFRPMKAMVKRVINNNSENAPRSVKLTLSLIADILQ